MMRNNKEKGGSSINNSRSGVSLLLLIQHYIYKKTLPKVLKSIYLLLGNLFLIYLAILVVYWVLLIFYMLNFRKIANQLPIAAKFNMPLTQSLSLMNYKISSDLGLIKVKFFNMNFVKI